MTLKSESTYTSRRTYILKLRSDAGPAFLSGRLENLVTGKQFEFSSDKELLASLTCDLQADTTERTPATAETTHQGSR